MASRSVLLLESSFHARQAILEVFRGDPHLVFLGAMSSESKTVKMLQSFLPQTFMTQAKFLTEDFVKALSPFLAGGDMGFVIYGDGKERHEVLLLARRHLKTSFCDYVIMGNLDVEAQRQEFRHTIHNTVLRNHKPFVLNSADLLRKEKALEHVNTLATQVVVIGSSAGGPRILRSVLSKIPEEIQAGILVVQHIEDPFTQSLVASIARETSLTVSEAKDLAPIYNGCVYVAPGGFHLEAIPFRNGGMCKLNKGDPVFSLRPAVDNLMLSIPKVYGNKVIGIILTGMGRDGVVGMKAIKLAGGMTIAQDKATSMVFGMPKAAIESGCVDRVLPYTRIATVVAEHLAEINALSL